MAGNTGRIGETRGNGLKLIQQWTINNFSGKVMVHSGNGSSPSDPIIMDFTDVEVLTPSFADEFVNGIKKNYQDKEIKIQGYENNNLVKETLLALKLI